MSGLGRKIGVVGFVLSVGVACTQLFGEEQNTLAPPTAPRAPTIASALPMPGAERSAVCTPGEMRCEGALLQTCADDLTSWVTVDRCAAAALCQASPATCLAATCNADEMTCAGSVLQKCNADRTGWDVFDTCLSPAHCNARERQCLGEPCSPGQRRCDRSDADQSPLLEVCQDDRLNWSLLDACVTRELCDQTLNPALVGGGLVIGSDGMVQIEAPVTPESVIRCNLPVCAAGEVRCEGAQLQVCAQGQTGWAAVEDCASEALCAGSLSNVDAAGVLHCLPPACALNQHQCTLEGELQVCSVDRTGYRTIQTCIGPSFCNAALADQGEEGCRSAPCEAGEMQCNGAQIQVCRQDRTGLDNAGAPCESPALCNASDPRDAFCEEPACRRGATSGDEFRCDGAQLQRCNEQLTGYDTFATCETAALCDSSQRFDGCRPPTCRPGQRACSPDGILRTCNQDQTGFEDTENCGNRAQCDANAGRCSDPCEPGAVRCNTQSGDLEECRDLLSGWQTIGDCVSRELCDAGNRRCNAPVCNPGERRCETRNGSPVILQCAPGREAFVVSRTCAAGQICDAQNNECDVCAPNSTTCDGDTLVRCDARGQSQARQNPSCGPGLCSAERGRCLVCNPINSARCVDLQLRVCTQGQGGNEFERSENCDTDELCAQTLNGCGRGLNGQNCQCNDGVCAPNQLRCNNGQIQRCNGGLTGFDTIQQCANGCNAGNTVCNECSGNAATCVNGQLRRCVNGFFRNEPCQFGCNEGSNSCNDCQGNGALCQNGQQIQRCVNGRFQVEPCQFGCNNGSNACNQCSGNGSSCVNNDIRRCVNGAFQTQDCGQPGCNGNGTACNLCVNNAGTCANNDIERCVNGQPQIQDCGNNGCNPGSTTCNNCSTGQCNGNQFTPCNNGRLGATVTCNDTDGNVCTGVACNPQQGCVTQNLSGNSCSDNNACTGNEVCQNGACSNPPDVSCPAPPVCRTVSCNPQNGQCVTGNQPEGSNCPGGSCRGGNCVPNQVCTPNSATCASGTTRSVCNPQGSGTTTTACGNATPFCVGTTCRECRNAGDCNDGNACTTDSCSPAGVCTNGTIAGCTPCTGTAVSCVNNDIQRCVNGRLETTDCGAQGCVGGSTTCNVACTQGQRRCNGTTPEECRFGLNPSQTVPLFTPIPACDGGVTITTCPGANGTPQQRFCSDGNACTGASCSGTQCVFPGLNGQRCTATGLAGTCNAAGQCCLPEDGFIGGGCLTLCTTAADCAPGDLCNEGVCEFDFSAPR